MSNKSIKQMGEQHVMNTYGRFPVAMVRGEGSKLYDGDGKEYIDFLAGIAVTLLGHANPIITEAITKQANTLLHCSNYYWIEPQNKLAELLCQNSCMDKAFFCNSGAEANEGAIKLARKYSATKYGEGRHKILTLEQSFHGRTLATLTATGQEHFHKDFLPLVNGFDYVPMNNLAAFKEKVDDSVCALIMEPIQGEGGVYPMDPEVAKEIEAYCKKNDILLIVDEVQTGIGRTGKLFGYQTLGIEPDIMTLAKALGGGVPIGATLAKDEVAKAFVPGDHASTFGGNPLASAAGLAVMQTVTQDGFMDEVNETAAYFRSKLEELVDKHPFTEDVRGKGLMLALELGQDSKPVLKACLEAGLLLTTAGKTALRFLPALNISKQEIDEGMQILTDVLSQMK